MYGLARRRNPLGRVRAKGATQGRLARPPTRRPHAAHCYGLGCCRPNRGYLLRSARSPRPRARQRRSPRHRCSRWRWLPLRFTTRRAGLPSRRLYRPPRTRTLSKRPRRPNHHPAPGPRRAIQQTLGKCALGRLHRLGRRHHLGPRLGPDELRSFHRRRGLSRRCPTHNHRHPLLAARRQHSRH